MATCPQQWMRSATRYKSVVLARRGTFGLTLTDDDSFRITWDPPSDDGGSPVTGYTLEVSRPRLSASVGPWSRIYSPSSTSFVINGRKNATYAVKVAATNRAGTGRSVTDHVATGGGDECSEGPEPPRDVRIWIDGSSGERRLVAEWPAAVCTGNAALLTHRVTWSRAGWESDAVLIGGTTSVLRDELHNPRYDTTYTVRVETINRAREVSQPIQRSFTTGSDPTPWTTRLRCLQRVGDDTTLLGISELVGTADNYAAEAAAQMALSVAANNVVVSRVTDDSSDLRSGQLGSIRRNTGSAEIASVWARKAANGLKSCSKKWRVEYRPYTIRSPLKSISTTTAVMTQYSTIMYRELALHSRPRTRRRGGLRIAKRQRRSHVALRL